MKKLSVYTVLWALSGTHLIALESLDDYIGNAQAPDSKNPKHLTLELAHIDPSQLGDKVYLHISSLTVRGGEENTPFIKQQQFQELLKHFPNLETFRIEKASISWNQTFWPTQNTSLGEQIFEDCTMGDISKNFFQNTPALHTLRFINVTVNSTRKSPFTGLDGLKTLSFENSPTPPDTFFKRIPTKNLTTLGLKNTPLSYALALVESHIRQRLTQDGLTLSQDPLETALNAHKSQYFKLWPSGCTNPPLTLDIKGSKTPKEDIHALKKLYKIIGWPKNYLTHDPLPGKIAKFFGKIPLCTSHQSD